MRLAFLATHEKYFEMASVMVESAREVMPGIHICHLADDLCPPYPGADEVRRCPAGMEFGLIRMWHFCNMEGQWISADVDIKFQGDVWHVFDDDFDMACASRIGTKWGISTYAQVMPYNNGILWSRGPEFWRDQIRDYGRMPVGWRVWCEQLLFNNTFLSGRFKTKVLPCKYNYPPDEKDADSALVLHYKGTKRKRLMEI